MAYQTCPPGPSGLPVLGSLLDIRRNPLQFLIRLQQQYGDVVYFRVGRRRLFLISEPEYIREVLVTHHKAFIKSRALQLARKVLGRGLLTSEGELHLRQRRMLQPEFHKRRVAEYGGRMVEIAAKLSTQWQDGQTVDMAREMMHVTLRIAANTLFSKDVDSHEADRVGEALSIALRLFERVTSPFAEWLDYLPLPSTLRFRRARKQLDRIIYSMIAERRHHPNPPHDLLTMLLQAQDTEGDGRGMSDRQVRDEAMTIFLAGHETTAIALTWTWYLLSEYPAVRQTLQQELDTVLRGRWPTVSDIPNLRYTRNVLAEAMRLYPPAYIIGREAVRKVQIGPYTLQPGDTVLMSQYIVHRLERFFPQPERFNPDRWTPEFQEQLPKFAYFPFGGGPRVCIGEPFAWMEGILVLAVLARDWTADLVPGHPVELLPLITLRPRHGLRMRLHRRQRNEHHAEIVKAHANTP